MEAAAMVMTAATTTGQANAKNPRMCVLIRYPPCWSCFQAVVGSAGEGRGAWEAIVRSRSALQAWAGLPWKNAEPCSGRPPREAGLFHERRELRHRGPCAHVGDAARCCSAPLAGN